MLTLASAGSVFEKMFYYYYFFFCSLFSETQAVSVSICDGACWTLLGEKWIWRVPKVYNLVSMFKKISGIAHSAWSQL